jgi:hypothetical protein
MNDLCADKTGTLMEGTVKLQGALDALGTPNEKALFYAYLNSFMKLVSQTRLTKRFARIASLILGVIAKLMRCRTTSGASD